MRGKRVQILSYSGFLPTLFVLSYHVELLKGGIKVTRGCVMTRAKLQERHAHAYLLVHQSTHATRIRYGHLKLCDELGNIRTHVH
jgi:hypothetical protein